MIQRIFSAILGAFIVILGLPGIVTAPVAFVSAAAPETPRLARFIARLPLAQASRTPRKLIGPNGAESLGVKTTARRVYVTDSVSGAVLYARNENEQTPLASITKLMTARVVRERGLDWNAQVTITTTNDGGGAAYFFPGDTVTVRDLWKAMLIGSSNTAAETLARATGLTPEQFVQEMNASAVGLGMTHTAFVDPTGLDKGNVSTASDVSLLAKAEFADPEIATTTVIPSFMLTTVQGKSRRVISTDKLLTTFINKSPYQILGAKTGFINESGYNMVLSVSRENASTIIVVVLGAGSDLLRFQEAKSVAYWTFQNFRWPTAPLASAGTR